MDICRACLTNSKCVVLFDDNFISGYNLLTSLNVKALDGLSQFVCQTCISTVNSFLNFREQCISSEAMLQQQLLQTIKSEPDEISDQNEFEGNIEKSIEKPSVKQRVGRPRKAVNNNGSVIEKLSVKRRVGRPRKAVIKDGSGKFESHKKNNAVTALIKKCVGRPRKNVSATDTNNGTWVVRPRQQKTTSQNTSNDSVKHPRYNISTTNNSQKWVICPRKNATTGITHNSEISSVIELPSKNISDEKNIDNIIHESELLLPYKDVIVKNIDLPFKEETDSTDDNSVFDNLDTTISEYEIELELIKNEDLEDVVSSETVKPAHNKKEDKTIILCDNKIVKSKTIGSAKNKKEDTSIPCGLCKKNLENQESLSSHLDDHRSGTRCEVCKETFDQWQALLAHRLQHVKSRKHHKCHICLAPQRSPVYFEYHYLTMHSDKDVKDITLSCKTCFKKYSDPVKLRRHLKHNHKAIRFTCDKCSKPFAHKFMLNKHMRLHYDDRPYACDICEYSSKYLNSLQIHVLRKHTESTVNCSACFRVFANNEKLEKHVCSRKKEKVCPICGVVTKFLRHHMTVHSDARKYTCKRCPATFKVQSALQVHMNKHDDLRPHRCEFCPMRFNSGSVLIKHRRVHTGEKPYVCRICSKGFTGNHNLKVHMRVHGEHLVVKRNALPPQEPQVIPGKF